MKKLQRIKRLVVSSLFFALLLTPSVFAKGRKGLTIYQRARVNDTVLEVGDYKVEVAEKGASSEVMIYKGKELVAKAMAQAEKLEKKIDRNSVRLTVSEGTVPKIIELRLAGQQQVYRFES